MILPDVNAIDSAPFWDFASRHRLTVQRCTQCARFRFPPHRHCGHCQSDSSTWTEVSGDGQVWSFAEVHGPTLPHLNSFLPFPVVVVALAEDPRIRMPGNVVATPGAPINSVPASALTIGLPVRVTFEDVAPGVSLPRWAIRHD